MECIVANEILHGDWIYVHHNGQVFNGNDYSFQLVDGRAKRNFLIGETITYESGKETNDLYGKPLMPEIEVNY